jgi:isoamylase
MHPQRLLHRWDPAKVLIDPYAPLVKGRALFGVRDDFERFQEKARRPPP